jgi:uncharacterized membrane protein YbaN (DUF454 family)
LNPRKVFFNIAGTFFVGLGIAGAILPLLPATPFFLLASACYVRGSDRLHAWLMNHRLFGAYIRNFQSGAGVPRRAKIVMVIMLWASIAYSIIVVDILAARITMVAVLIGVTTLIVRLKTLPEE